MRTEPLAVVGAPGSCARLNTPPATPMAQFNVASVELVKVRLIVPTFITDSENGGIVAPLVDGATNKLRLPCANSTSPESDMREKARYSGGVSSSNDIFDENTQTGLARPPLFCPSWVYYAANICPVAGSRSIRIAHPGWSGTHHKPAQSEGK